MPIAITNTTCNRLYPYDRIDLVSRSGDTVYFSSDLTMAEQKQKHPNDRGGYKQQVGSIWKKKQSSQQQAGDDPSSTRVGSIPGLPMYHYGAKNHSDEYVKTTEAIGNYVGREFGKNMRMIVLKGKEHPPKLPNPPDAVEDKDDVVSVVVWKAYEKGVDHYYKEDTKYREQKSRVFVIIMGQCTTAMKHKVEGSKGYDEMETNDDVVALLQLIKDLSFTNTNVQYPFFAVADQWRRVGLLHQFKDEPITTYYNRWMAHVEALESQYGPLVPNELVDDTNGIDKPEAGQRFKACLFLLAVDRGRYGNVLEELNNQYLNGLKTYPLSVEGAVSMLTHRMTTGKQSLNNNNKQSGSGQPSADQVESGKNFHQASSGKNENDNGAPKASEDETAGTERRRSNSIWFMS